MSSITDTPQNDNAPTEDLTESLPTAAPEITKRTLRRSLARLREQYNVSLTELARRSGVSRGYLHLLEKGENSPTLEILTKLADAFGIPLPMFLFDVSGWTEFSHDELRLIHAYRRGDMAEVLILMGEMLKREAVNDAD